MAIAKLSAFSPHESLLGEIKQDHTFAQHVAVELFIDTNQSKEKIQLALLGLMDLGCVNN